MRILGSLERLPIVLIELFRYVLQPRRY